MKLKRMITIGVMGLGLAAPVAAEDFTGTLAKVAESGVITIGHRESSVPVMITLKPQLCWARVERWIA